MNTAYLNAYTIYPLRPTTYLLCFQQHSRVVRSKKEILFKVSGVSWAAGQIERVMLARAGGGQAFVPRSPAPSPQHLFSIPHLPPTSYLLCFHQYSRFCAESSTVVLCFQQHSRVVRSKKETLFKVGGVSWATGQIERVMLARAGGGQAFVPQSPAPSPQPPHLTPDT